MLSKSGSVILTGKGTIAGVDMVDGSGDVEAENDSFLVKIGIVASDSTKRGFKAGDEVLIYRSEVL